MSRKQFGKNAPIPIFVERARRSVISLTNLPQVLRCCVIQVALFVQVCFRLTGRLNRGATVHLVKIYSGTDVYIWLWSMFLVTALVGGSETG